MSAAPATSENDPADPGRPATGGSVPEVFTTFLKLGLTSFGGPIAHLGYFRRELVERRHWVGESQYAQLLALSQFLPGPASSQLGFSLGLLRAGWGGALAAFLAFTLPSALLLFLFATFLPHVSGTSGEAALHGLKLVALAVVAHGVLGMTRQLCPDPTRAAMATVAAVVILVTGPAWVSLLVVGGAGLLGLVLCRQTEAVTTGHVEVRFGPRFGTALLVLFGVLLVGLPLAAHGLGGLLAVGEAFFRAGALVFGGGHVVLPFLEETVVAPGWVTADDFLAGYGAAQAVPGPMFSFSAYLGALVPQAGGGLAGASIALAGIFLPGFLLISGVLPLWRALASRPLAARVIAGVNASVVGLLGAALYDPIWTSAIRHPADVAIALVGFTLLASLRVSALLVVLWCVLASVLTAAVL